MPQKNGQKAAWLATGVGLVMKPLRFIANATCTRDPHTGVLLESKEYKQASRAASAGQGHEVQRIARNIANAK